MTLANLSTPFERRRIIEYGADGCKVVRHWYNVQHVSGSLYKGEETDAEYGQKLFNLYIIFPETDTGLLYQKMGHSDWYTVEQMLAAAVRDHVDTAEHMIADLNGCMRRNQFIGNALIEFVRQFDPERAECYAKYREDFCARKAAKDREKALARQAEEDAEKARQQAELEKAKAKYLGWADGMTPMRFGKISVTMDTLIRVDGALMTKRDFIISKIKEGWIPMKDEGVTSWYGSKWERKESKPRTEYKLYQAPYAYKITKTEYEFAQYLVDRNIM